MPFVLPVLGAALAAPPSLVATRTPEPPVLDGSLADAAWDRAVATDSFTQRFPRQGEASSERTILRVLYDDDALYVGFDCEQRSSPIVARLTRRDRPIEADRVSFAIDSRMDGTTAFEFIVNAAGVLSDSIRFNDTESSPDWDDNWDARTARTDHGWSAEFRIPLRVLRFRNANTQKWGFQARRYVSMRQEESTWAFIPRETAKEVSGYGTLVGLAGLSPNDLFELRPYVLGRIRRSDASIDTLSGGVDLAATAGLDIEWHPTQDLTLDVSANPDFAQVEADQVILNLTPRYEVLLPERRPFFLEGKDVFTTPFQLFYTRRIGRVAPSPSLRTEAPYDEKLAAVPTPATLYGASKLIGRVAPRWSVGIVNTVAARNDVLVAGADGTRTLRLSEPLTGFNVLRVKRDVGDNGHIGLLATSTLRGEDAGGYAPLTLAPFTGGASPRVLCPSGEVLAPGQRCFHNAHVGGVDWRWRSKTGDYVFTGQAIASAIQGGPDRTLPDGTTIKSGDADGGVLVRAGKEGGKPWTYDLRYTAAGKRLDYNDLGYMLRQNMHDLHGGLTYRTVDPWWRTVTTENYVEALSRWSWDGLGLGQTYRVGTWFQYDNFWETWIEANVKPTWVDDREVGDGAALERAGRFGFRGYLGTDPRKTLRFELEGGADAVPGGINSIVEAIVTLRTLPQLDLQLLPQAVYADGEQRYAGGGTTPGSYLFGSFRAANVGATLRATYTFTPRLSFQTYAQMYLASGHYENFTAFQAQPASRPPVIRRRDLVATAAPTTNPDFVDAALNINAVLRWEYQLGSTLFLVYTRSQSPRVELAPGSAARLSFTSLSRAAASDVLLVKLTYWWG